MRLWVDARIARARSFLRSDGAAHFSHGAGGKQGMRGARCSREVGRGEGSRLTAEVCRGCFLQKEIGGSLRGERLSREMLLGRVGGVFRKGRGEQ